VVDEQTPDEADERSTDLGWIGSVVGVLVVVGVLGWLAMDQPELPEFDPSGPAVDIPHQPVSAVSLEEFEGILVGLRGKPVVVNIWGSWCAPCRTEMPLLQAAADSYKSEAVVLGVSSRDNPDSARDFLLDANITYPNVSDGTGQIARALDVNTFPTTYVFDAQGDLVARVNGGITEQRIAGLLGEVLP